MTTKAAGSGQFVALGHADELFEGGVGLAAPQCDEDSFGQVQNASALQQRQAPLRLDGARAVVNHVVIPFPRPVTSVILEGRGVGATP
jgi:hypothetical protein